MDAELRFEFSGAGDFEAYDAAHAWCESIGVSVGSMQRDEPIGLMFGDWDIAKWRNLDKAERAALHGHMTGNKRLGPVVVSFRQPVPKELRAALAKAAARKAKGE